MKKPGLVFVYAARDFAQVAGTHGVLEGHLVDPAIDGQIARKLSHRKLISGKPLRHSTYQEIDIDPTDQELLTEEEYAILSQEEAERKEAK